MKRFAALQSLIKTENLMTIGPIMAIYHDDYHEYDSNNADIEMCYNGITNSSKIIDSTGIVGSIL